MMIFLKSILNFAPRLELLSFIPPMITWLMVSISSVFAIFHKSRYGFKAKQAYTINIFRSNGNMLLGEYLVTERLWKC